MTRSPHAKLTRNALRWGLIAAALGSVQVASANLLSKAVTSIPYSSTGRSVSMGSGPLSAATTAGRGAPAGSTQIGNSGWHYGTGATHNPSSGQTMTMGANGDVYLAGTKYPFQAGYSVPVSDVATAALGLIGGWPGLAITGALIAAPHIKDWLDGAGVRPRADGQGFEQKEDLTACETNCYFWKNDYNRTSASPTDLCNDNLGGANPDYLVVSVSVKMSNNGGTAWCEGKLKNGTWGGSWQLQRLNSRPADNIVYLPKSMDDIAPYLMRSMFSPDMVKDIINNGGAIPLGTPTITGPSQIQGQPTTSVSTGTQTVNGQQVPTRTETTTQTTYNFTTNNNQVTNTTNNTVTTTVTTNQSTGVVIGTTTTETQTKPEETDERTECEKNPKLLNCSDLDTPDGEIPKAKFNVTYSIEDSWGGGSCPADVYTNVGGQSIKAYDWQQTCGYVSTYVRPILYILCAFGALMIIYPGKTSS